MFHIIAAVKKYTTISSKGKKLRHSGYGRKKQNSPKAKSSRIYTILPLLFTIFLIRMILMSDSDYDHIQDDEILHCLSEFSEPTQPISSVTYFPSSPLYSTILRSNIRNLRFNSPTTPKPRFIVRPTRVPHIQTTVICCRKYGLEIRIRSGGHDYDGLSYVSQVPFVLLDMSSLRSVEINLKDETAWVDSGATLGEVYYKIAEKSQIHGFPAGVCPTVGVGGHFSGAGYGNMMRKFGLTVDNMVDAILVDANGRVMDRAEMGEDLFWAIRGGGGASFGVIVSWKIKLVPVPETVTVFRVEKTLEQGATDIVHRWQYVANTIDRDLFIRVVLTPVNKNGQNTIEARFLALFLGNANRLFDIMTVTFPELGLERKQCIEMRWVDSILYWSDYPLGTELDVLLEKNPKPERFLKRKSDYVQEPISKSGLEDIWNKMRELEKPVLALNPYGGRMSEISELETPFPHRAGNLYKIQYSVNWVEKGDDAANRYIDLIRSLYDYMTPYVSKSPRSSYFNYRDVDLGVHRDGDNSYEEASTWGRKYFKGNFDKLVEVKTMVDPSNFFRNEQSIPTLPSWTSAITQ